MGVLLLAYSRFRGRLLLLLVRALMRGDPWAWSVLACVVVVACFGSYSKYREDTQPTRRQRERSESTNSGVGQQATASTSTRRPSTGGVQEGLVAAVVGVLILGVFGGILLFASGGAADPEPEAAVTQSSQPEGDSSAATATVASNDSSQLQVRAKHEEDLAEAELSAIPAARAEPEPPTFPDEEAVLKALQEGGHTGRLAAAEAWLEQGLWREEGSRFRFLQAVHAGGVDGDLLHVVQESFERQAPDLEEAVRCFPLVEGGLRRGFLEQFVAEGRGRVDVIEAVVGVQDASDPDPALDEALIELGHFRAGTCESLLATRGLDWCRSGRGRELLGAVARHEPASLAPLVEHEDPAARVLACELLDFKGNDVVLRMLVTALGDESTLVRRAAAEALGDVGDPRATWRLALALHAETDSSTQARLLESLKKLPKESTFSQLDTLLAVEQEGHRLAAVTALERLECEESVPRLVQALGDRVASVRAAALRALATAQRTPELRPGVSAGVEAIRGLASDPDRQIAGRARKLYFAIMGRYP